MAEDPGGSGCCLLIVESYTVIYSKVGVLCETAGLSPCSVHSRLLMAFKRKEALAVFCYSPLCLLQDS